MDLSWWIGWIGVPLVGAIFGCIAYVWRSLSIGCDNDFRTLQTSLEANKLYGENDRADLRRELEKANRELYDYKLYVAEHFATMLYAREIETRISASLLRIEAKMGEIDAHLRHTDSRINKA